MGEGKRRCQSRSYSNETQAPHERRWQSPHYCCNKGTLGEIQCSQGSEGASEEGEGDESGSQEEDRGGSQGQMGEDQGG